MKTTRRRPWGSGTVEPYRGRFRARLPGKERTPIGVFGTEEQANRELDAVLFVAAQEGVRADGVETVRKYGGKFLDQREALGLRNVDTDRSRWKHHIETAPFIDWPIASVHRRDVKAWSISLTKKRAADDKETRQVSFQTRKHAVNLLRAMFAAALEDELVAENPAARVKLVDDGATDEGWTYLTLDEQLRIAACDKILEPDLLRILFAVYTGVRQGEQWNLELQDLRHEDREPHVVVRKGSKARSPKAKKIRRVVLIPAAVAVVRRWLELLPKYAKENKARLVFPTPRGCRRGRGKLYGFKKHLTEAGITRPVRWHDLRHTCGSSLVAGWWGRPWRLEEVRDVLGHASIVQTERYAHLAPSVVSRAAAETNCHQTASTVSGSNANGAGIPGRATEDSNFRPTAPEALALRNDLAALGALDGSLLAKSLQYLRAVESRNRHARRYAEELARAVLALRVVGLAQALLEGGRLSYSAGDQLAGAIVAACDAVAAARRSG